MRIVIAGGHGKIALLLERLLAERGDQAVGLIRNPAHVADVRAAGAEAVVRNLEAASGGDVAALFFHRTSRGSTVRDMGSWLRARKSTGSPVTRPAGPLVRAGLVPGVARGAI